MRAIRNFLHNINDIVLAILIVAIAAVIVWWRMSVILDYPEKMADQAVIVQDDQDAEDESDEITEEDADRDADSDEGNDSSGTEDEDDNQ